MRLIARILFLLSLTTVLSPAVFAQEDSEVEFVRIWPQWREANSFLRISEYFGGEENTGRQIVLRSQPEKRGGFYFLVRARSRETDYEDAKFVLEVITPASPDPKSYEFPVTISKGSRVFNLGLTGSDWKDAETHPVAWRLRLVDGNGRELVSRQSFLWSLPSSS